jgi:3,4-dihydroxy 2-butanone 4-phosphate synthase/GTP cyclohydrolase II
MVPIERLTASAREHHLKTGRPLITLSYAQSLDGSIAALPGQPLALSGPQSLRLTHQLRRAHAAILVGIGTVLADDPRLTVRLVEGVNPRLVGGESPRPVVLDSRLRTPLDSRLLRHPLNPWIATLHGADPVKKAQLEEAGAQVFSLPASDQGRVSLPATLAMLAGQGVDSLMVEGGSQVLGAFLSQNLADVLVLTIAPVFVGGLRIETTGESNFSTPVGGFTRLSEMGCEILGDDLVVWGRLAS